MMPKTRLEAFSDGVLAIIITIMVLELKVPHGEGLAAILPLLPAFFSYILSFIFVGIYWNNHHHLLHTVKHVSGGVLWANLHLLFWLSLLPFVTGWMGENHFAPMPTAFYGGVLMMAGIAYWILTGAIIREDSENSLLSKAIGKDIKGKLSVVLCAASIPLAFVDQWIAQGIFILIALTWLVPDRRIERVMKPEA
jgi:uncharacterized membrane protein